MVNFSDIWYGLSCPTSRANRTSLKKTVQTDDNSYFQLILSDKCPGGWATSFLFVVDCPCKLHTIYSIIDSSSGETFFLKWFTISDFSEKVLRWGEMSLRRWMKSMNIFLCQRWDPFRTWPWKENFFKKCRLIYLRTFLEFSENILFCINLVDWQ